MFKFLLISILLGIITISCSSFPQQKNIEIQHKIVITNKGTRSEGKWGVLTIEGNEVPPVFSKIIVDGQAYDFLIREYAWQKGGYWPIDKSVDPGFINNYLRKKEIRTGWYKGTLEEYRRGTPSYWIWVNRKDIQNFSYWLDPYKLGDFITDFNLNAIDSNQTGMLEIPKSMEKTK